MKLRRLVQHGRILLNRSDRLTLKGEEMSDEIEDLEAELAAAELDWIEAIRQKTLATKACDEAAQYRLDCQVKLTNALKSAISQAKS